jgi:hypothetical protein
MVSRVNDAAHVQTHTGFGEEKDMIAAAIVGGLEPHANCKILWQCQGRHGIGSCSCCIVPRQGGYRGGVK